MTTALQITLKDTGASAAGQVLAPVINVGLGVPASIAASTVNISPVFGGDSVSGTSSYCGFRRELGASVDLTDRQYIQFQLAHTGLARGSLQDWTSNGLMLVFEDTLGNWAAYRILGGDAAWNVFGVASDG